MDERDGYFVVEMSMRCRQQLEGLERQTMRSKPTIAEVLFMSASADLVERLIKKLGEGAGADELRACWDEEKEDEEKEDGQDEGDSQDEDDGEPKAA